MTATTPMKCIACLDVLVETEEGMVPGFYGRLWFATDPPNPKCPNCDAPLVPSASKRSSAE